MKLKNKIIVTIVSLFLMGFVMTPELLAFKRGEIYFTKVNIWYETPKRVYSTNYHKGKMLPVGTEIEIIKPKGKKIRFLNAETGELLYLHHIRKYTQVTTQDLLSRYFSETSVLEDEAYRKFTKKEKDAIANGRIEKGMSKEAVIMAYGYPPTHQTPFLEDSVWTFWRTRTTHFKIKFEGNLLVGIG